MHGNKITKITFYKVVVSLIFDNKLTLTYTHQANNILITSNNNYSNYNNNLLKILLLSSRTLVIMLLSKSISIDINIKPFRW